MMSQLSHFNTTYLTLPQKFYTKEVPLSTSKPKLLYFNENLAKALEFSEYDVKRWKEDYYSMRHLPEESALISQSYMGHQFGYLTMLGDGRALLLGEVLSQDRQRFDIQYKGSGRTAFSRGGDGKATLGPMLKEYLFSEAMYQLGIPTARSLSVALTGDTVYRDKPLQGAVLTRVASSHLRIGTFQFAAYQGSINDLKSLADYAMERHYPKVVRTQQPYLAFYREVVKAQAHTIALWMAYGFIHGVMNTDNMTISGESIDYGPCAFIDKFDLKAVYSSIDTQGRYAFGNQKDIGKWNLARFAEALVPLIHGEGKKATELLTSVLEDYDAYFEKTYYQTLAKRLGLLTYEAEDDDLIWSFLKTMEAVPLDYHNVFLDLTFDTVNKHEYQNNTFEIWLKRWQNRVASQDSETMLHLMKSTNPALIARNYWVDQAISLAEKGDFSLYEALYQALSDPFAHAAYQNRFQHVPANFDYVTYCGT
ncbi:YdiU family protein [Peptoniphilus equinus]|uniref:Protein nucleotidyltransferase YdiU n=1 Tax=Peptoniphilus equinus TaxID=3016343 RepID=A0ABY7QWY2_9FIRM|nr:YdiU family protein [Peptoniphilus equinus]WBW50738.1 YdiU family protein [Peptoniphilus equinus]